MGFAYNAKYVNMRGSNKPNVQWINGRQVTREVGKATNLAMCVYPNDMLNMITAYKTAQPLN